MVRFGVHANLLRSHGAEWVLSCPSLITRLSGSSSKGDNGVQDLWLTPKVTLVKSVGGGSSFQPGAP